MNLERWWSGSWAAAWAIWSSRVAAVCNGSCSSCAANCGMVLLAGGILFPCFWRKMAGRWRNQREYTNK